jgi:hypothetical protein
MTPFEIATIIISLAALVVSIFSYTLTRRAQIWSEKQLLDAQRKKSFIVRAQTASSYGLAGREIPELLVRATLCLVNLAEVEKLLDKLEVILHFEYDTAHPFGGGEKPVLTIKVDCDGNIRASSNDATVKAALPDTMWLIGKDKDAKVGFGSLLPNEIWCVVKDRDTKSLISPSGSHKIPVGAHKHFWEIEVRGNERIRQVLEALQLHPYQIQVQIFFDDEYREILCDPREKWSLMAQYALYHFTLRAKAEITGQKIGYIIGYYILGVPLWIFLGLLKLIMIASNGLARFNQRLHVTQASINKESRD